MDNELLVKVMTREEELAAREAIDQRNKVEEPVETKEDQEKRLELVNYLNEALTKRGIEENHRIAFCMRASRTLRELTKLVQHIIDTDNGEIKDTRKMFPSAAQFAEWSKKEKTLATLGEIKFPTLCGWTEDEVVWTMRPYVMTHSKRYATNRTSIEDCLQHGSMGVLEALDSDAGISPFSNHAWKTVQTNIRRPAATSGVIKEPEKRPSLTEVRHEITGWLCGWWIEYEMERLMSTQGMAIFKSKQKDGTAKQNHKDISAVLDKGLDLVAVGYDAAYRTFNIEKHGRDKSKWDKDALRNIDLTAWQQSRNLTPVGAAMWRMTDGSKVPTQVLKEFRRVAESNANLDVNLESFTTEKDLELCCIQKTGITWGMEYFVEQSYRLDRLPIDKLFELGDYLNRKYRLITPQELLKKKHDVCYRYPIKLPNQEKFQTVCDLVKHVASAPDFHGNPVSLDNEADDGYMLRDTIGSLDEGLSFLMGENREQLLELVEALSPRLSLTKEQRGVMEYLFGLNGKQVTSGSYLADHFGELIPGATRSAVSRQRITQYQDTIVRRIIEELFKHMFYERVNPQGGLERAIRVTEMCVEDTDFALRYFAMVENAASLAWMVEHLHEMIPAFSEFCSTVRREFVKERIIKIKTKMLKPFFG